MNGTSKIDKLVEAIQLNNSNTDMHREQHKCLWNGINENKADIRMIKEDLNCVIPGKEGLFVKVNMISSKLDEIKEEMNKYINRGYGMIIACSLIFTAIGFIISQINK